MTTSKRRKEVLECSFISVSRFEFQFDIISHSHTGCHDNYNTVVYYSWEGQFMLPKPPLPQGSSIYDDMQMKMVYIFCGMAFKGRGWRVISQRES